MSISTKVLAAGATIALGMGAVVVSAQENVMRVVIEAQRPIRQGFETLLPREKLQFPRIVRREPSPKQAAAFAAEPRHGQSSLASRPQPPWLPAALPTPSGFPAQVSDLLHPPASPALAGRVKRAKRAKDTVENWKAGKGLTQATDYCVRTCDGYAFPIGPSGGSSSRVAHEVACQLACPGAETALYSAPAGARDIESASRAGRLYSALPTAFRYRENYDSACLCRPKGTTQSSSALLADFTLRRGDLAMTRIGMRHFDGSSAKLPHRAEAFSDAIAKLKDRRERDQVRAMEAASVRGLIPANAQAFLRERVTDEIRLAERAANPPRLIALRRIPGHFEAMRPLQTAGPQPVRVITRRAGLVALN